MGWYAVGIEVHGRRSAHNSLQDELDKIKWAYLRQRILELTVRDDYESLDLVVSDVNEM